MNTSEILNRAADLIEEKGWVAGSGWRGSAEAGPLCVEGAIQAAMGVSVGPGYRCPAYSAVCAYLEMAECGLWAWNDHLKYDTHGGWIGGSSSTANNHARQTVIEVLRACALIEASREARDEQESAYATYAPNLASVSS